MTADAIIRVFVAATIALVGFGAYRWLIPRLRPTARLLAYVTLAAQVLTLGVALLIQPTSDAHARAWHLDREWNIPSTLASTQLALTAGVALATAWLAKTQAYWKRAYLVGICLVFLYLAADEYLEAHEFTTGWTVKFMILGGVIVAATLLVMLRSPRRSWIWRIGFLAGLALSAGGGLLIETQCGHPVFSAVGNCEKHYLLEEPLEFLGVWLALVSLLGQLSSLSPPIRIQRWLFTLPALWLLLLCLPEAVHQYQRYTARAKSAAVEFESGIHLRGHVMEGDMYALHLFLMPGRLDSRGFGFAGLGYSIHVIDQASGDSLHHNNKYAHLGHLMVGPGASLTYRQKSAMRLPQQLPANRAYWIVLTLWRSAGRAFAKQKILASDHPLLGDTQVVLSEFALPAGSAAPASLVPRAAFDNGFILEAVDLPMRAQAGETLPIVFSWRSEVDGGIEYTQFLHLGHVDSGEWTVFDQPPMGPRLPTRLWYRGLADSETWQVPLPADMAPGQYALFSGLYRSSDKERVPAKSAEGVYYLDARVPLGSLRID